MNDLIARPYPILAIAPQTPIEYLFKIAYDHVNEINYGQFLQVSIPKVGEAPISISNFNQEEGFIELLIRKVGTVTDAIFKLKAGDALYLRGPYGNGFDYEAYKHKNLIVIGGGSGVAPVRSIVERVYQHMEEVKKIEVLLGFKNKELILFKKDIDKWKENMSVTVTLDEGDETKDHYIGRITEHLDKLTLLENKDNYEDINIMIVGPPIMMKFTAIALSNYGIRDDKIWLSFERNMSCAVGKCGHCKINETYVCLDGPIFRYDKAKALID